MFATQRAFIEAAITEVREAKGLLLPLLTIQNPHAPWTAEALRDLDDHVDADDPVLRRAVTLVEAFELPFLAEEARLAERGLTLDADMAAFEAAMVDFERAFWDQAYAAYRADPGRWDLRPVPSYDVCETHRLDSTGVRRAIRDHGATSFDDLAPYLGTDRACSTCHTAVSRLLIQALRRAKGAPG